MKASQLISRLKTVLNVFIPAPKEWRLPKKSEVLIFDLVSEEVLKPYLVKYSFAKLAIRGESINIPCCFIAMKSLAFWKGKFFRAYIDAFIDVASPKLVITFIDNNIAFYEISKRFLNIKTILLQNGIRDNWLDLHDKTKKYYVDYMLVFGSSIAKYYSAHISGEILPIGSLINNNVSNYNNHKGKDVLFISQWQIEEKDGHAFHINYDGTLVNWDQFFMAEVLVLKFLDNWCAENGKKLKICGREKINKASEILFYSNYLKKCKWKYIPNTSKSSAYKLVDRAEMVVFIDSTLGYESIARGKKTAALTCRGENLNNKSRNFGWPENLPNNGPFWTNTQDNVQFRRIMTYLNTINEANWQEARNRFASKLMDFDLENNRFVLLLDKLLPKFETK